MSHNESQPVNVVDPEPSHDRDSEEHGRIGYGRYGRYTPVGLAILIVATVILIGVYQQRDTDENPTPVSRLVGQPAPEVTLTLFDGTPLPLADLKGQVVVLNFWAQWCAPCKNEAPVLQAFHEAEAEHGAVVVGVDLKNDQPERATAFVAEHGLTYPNGQDTGGSDPVHGPIEQAFGIAPLYPTTVFIAPDGTIADVYIGELNDELLREYVKSARGLS
jgi:cytochrome c biogenesis protein CcmG/thiol:disulfide interchange protein DsbE